MKKLSVVLLVGTLVLLSSQTLYAASGDPGHGNLITITPLKPVPFNPRDLRASLDYTAEDALALINYTFRGADTPTTFDADLTGDGVVDVLDVVKMINLLSPAERARLQVLTDNDSGESQGALPSVEAKVAAPEKVTGLENATEKSQKNAGKVVGKAGVLVARDGKPGLKVDRDETLSSRRETMGKKGSTPPNRYIPVETKQKMRNVFGR